MKSPLLEPDELEPRIRCFYSISGPKVVPTTIDTEAGLRATASQEQPIARGRYPDGSPNIRQPFWEVEAVRSADSIDQVLRELITLILPARPFLVRYVRESASQAIFGCNVSFERDRPLYEISPESLSEMASFKAPFLLDIFDYSS